MEKYYPNNLVSLDTIVDKWKNYNLRDLFFINCSFENTDFLNSKFLQLPSLINGEGVENPNYIPDDEHDDEHDDNKKYYETAYANIIELLKIIGIQEETKIFVYTELKIFEKIFINKEIIEETKDYWKGKCNYQNFLKLIKNTTCPPESEDLFIPNMKPFPTLKDSGFKDLYYFPELKLYLYIYDQRGGILVSEDLDKNKMKIIFEKCLRINKYQSNLEDLNNNSLISKIFDGEYNCLLNKYWCKKSMQIMYE